MYICLPGFQQEPCGFLPWPRPPAEHCHHNPFWLFQPEMLLLFPEAQQFTLGALLTALCKTFGKDT